MPRLSPQPQQILQRPEDFARFYDETHLSVYRYLMVLCAGSQVDAEEFTAEAFFRAWEKREQFNGSQSAALGWVIAIARNLLIDQRRSQNRHPAQSIEENDYDASEASVETILVDSEQLQQVLYAISRLPFPQGDIVTLRYVLGWQVKAIAEHLGILDNTVSVHIRRAIARLQAQLITNENIDQRAR